MRFDRAWQRILHLGDLAERVEELDRPAENRRE